MSDDQCIRSSASVDSRRRRSGGSSVFDRLTKSKTFASTQWKTTKHITPVIEGPPPLNRTRKSRTQNQTSHQARQPAHQRKQPSHQVKQPSHQQVKMMRARSKSRPRAQASKQLRPKTPNRRAHTNNHTQSLPQTQTHTQTLTHAELDAQQRQSNLRKKLQQTSSPVQEQSKQLPPSPPKSPIRTPTPSDTPLTSPNPLTTGLLQKFQNLQHAPVSPQPPTPPSSTDSSPYPSPIPNTIHPTYPNSDTSPIRSSPTSRREQLLRTHSTPLPVLTSLIDDEPPPLITPTPSPLSNGHTS